MPALTTAFANLLSTQFQSFLVNVGKDVPREWPTLLPSEDMTTNPWISAKISGLPLMQVKPEGQQFEPVLPIEGNTFQVTATPYGSIFSMSWEVWRDDKYGVMGEMWNTMGRGSRTRQEYQAFGVFNNAFAVNIGYNAYPLIGTAQTDLDGTTQSNRPSPDVTISQTAYQAAMVNFDLLNDEVSLPQNIRGRHILGHPTNRYLMREIFGSSGKVDTANNDLNATLNDGVTWQVSRYLTRTQDWFLMTGMADRDAEFLWRDRPRARTFDDPFIEAIDYTLYQRFAIRVGDWRWIYGSTVGY